MARRPGIAARGVVDRLRTRFFPKGPLALHVCPGAGPYNLDPPHSVQYRPLGQIGPGLGKFRLARIGYAAQLKRKPRREADIWSLGVVFYELLTLEPPFKALASALAAALGPCTCEAKPLFLLLRAICPLIFCVIAMEQAHLLPVVDIFSSIPPCIHAHVSLFKIC